MTDWNAVSIDFIFEEIKPAGPANRAVALVQTAVFGAVNAITGKYPERIDIDASPDASVEAAVASASREILVVVLPKQQQNIDAYFTSEVDKLPDDASTPAGIEVGKMAAMAVLDMRADDPAPATASYRPQTKPGVYIPTVTPVGAGVAESRKPWIMETASEYRPEPPPALDSELWARDFNEIVEIGSRDSSSRTEDQTAAAKFWAATHPKVYFPVIRSVTEQPGHDITRNARLLAAASQSIDDSIIAVFDAKYAYEFWRPVTAVRNADQDNNDATNRIENWVSLIDAPMHPEYPCAHCIVSSTIGTLLELDVGDDPLPVLSSASPTDPANVRQWNTIDEFVQEVSNARIWEGVHYRNSAEVGQQMGRLIAEAVWGAFNAAQ